MVLGNHANPQQQNQVLTRYCVIAKAHNTQPRSGTPDLFQPQSQVLNVSGKVTAYFCIQL